MLCSKILFVVLLISPANAILSVAVLVVFYREGVLAHSFLGFKSFIEEFRFVGYHC